MDRVNVLENIKKLSYIVTLQNYLNNKIYKVEDSLLREIP